MKPKITLLWTLLASLLLYSMSVFAQSASGPSLLASGAPIFAYSGDTGPGFWAEINPACAATPNSRQSPIDVRSAVEDPRLAPLDLTLDGTSFTLNNPGYTIQATADPTQRARNVLIVDGTIFKLHQFHFHTLSEHTFKGRHTGMELHAVFEDASSHFAVIGVLYTIGRQSVLLEKLIEAGLPEKTKSPETTVNDLNLRDAFTDTASYYTYPGSFTTPPCSEIVTWFVLKREAQFSPQQFEAFRKILGNDFRPTQKLNDRVVRATLSRRNSDDGGTQPE